MIRRVKLKTKDAAALQEFLGKARATLGDALVEMKLFGSKATGKDKPDSDIDVLVIVNKSSVELKTGFSISPLT